MIGMVVAGIAVVVAAVIIVLPLVNDLERRALDESVRKALIGHKFIALNDGATHYRWDGPEQGRVVVLVHGFSTPMFAWDGQVPALAAAGFRVLRYDLFGRGYSDRPATAYTPELFDRQLVGLLDGLGVAGPVDIVGLSMGGAITINFVDRHPERVRRFALIAPAGLGVQPPGAASVIGWPVIGGWLMRSFGDSILLNAVDEMLGRSPEKAAEVRRRYLEQLSYKGYKAAIRSTLLHMPMSGMEAAYRRAGALGRKCALFWGTADTVVPYALHAQVAATLPGVAFYALDGGSHAVNFEEPDRVNEHLVAFLTSQD